MIEDIVIVWFLVLGIFALTKEQMPFEIWQKVARDKDLELRSILFEPLTECLCCMASFWSCVWFGYNYQTDSQLNQVAIWWLGFFICFTIAAKKANFLDDSMKYPYLLLIGAYVYFLPNHNLECFICMISVVGLNYHLVRLLGSCRD